ncbi:supervillin-like [Diorhabda carinulata]|uniref:supervillin-like n=1 Tax=Diorhabda carinulata TaxID=1163345 RepID=UPI0025A00C73|nr:supervillin-like [Diorhabda carinulata]
MKPCDVIELQKSRRKDASFVIDYINVGRGFLKNPPNTDNQFTINKSEFVVWRIIENEFLAIDNAVFHNAETNLIRWTFEHKDEKDEFKESTIFFFWKGSKAVKSGSPLPPNFDNDKSIVHRIIQWSEPAIFFQIFPKPIVVFDGKYSDFNPNVEHMFIVRGELKEEIHLYELPFIKKNLRSRAIFIIIDPQKRTIFIWKGLRIMKEQEITLKESNVLETLKEYVNHWKSFECLQIREHEEDDIFIGDISTYWHYEKNCNYSPRLFFLNSITGKFLATEVEYSLGSKNHVAPFPFLQSHLFMTDIQPGLFLLDNNSDIWLISSGLTPSEELNALAVETAENYVKEKERQFNIRVSLKFVKLGAEPIEFTNLFPYWN